jgi:hypothetical protein
MAKKASTSSLEKFTKQSNQNPSERIIANPKGSSPKVKVPPTPKEK